MNIYDFYKAISTVRQKELEYLLPYNINIVYLYHMDFKSKLANPILVSAIPFEGVGTTV